MKKVILLLTMFSLLTSCGSENKSTATHGDGTGNIDIVDYLPTIDMIKTFSYADHGQTLFSASGVQEITVNNTTIKIIQTAHAHGKFYTGDVVQELITTFDDLYIKFYDESEKLYRHINLGDVQSESKTNTTTVYSHNEVIVGNKDEEISKKCQYTNITDKIKDTSNQTIKNGNFLVIKCEDIERSTYHIDKEYQHDINLDNKYSEKKKTTYKYYEKDIGLIAESTIGVVTQNPCHAKNCTYQKYIIYNYFAKVQ